MEIPFFALDLLSIFNQFTYKAENYYFKLITRFDLRRDLTVISEEPQGIEAGFEFIV